MVMSTRRPSGFSPAHPSRSRARLLRHLRSRRSIVLIESQRSWRYGALPQSHTAMPQQGSPTVPIMIAAHAGLSLHVIAFTGCVLFSEIAALGRVHAEHKDWAGADTFHLVEADADLAALTNDQLDAVRAHYRDLHQSIAFFLVRRSGWVCLAPAARPTVEYWLRGRHSRDGQGTEIHLAATFAGLSALFSTDEIAAAAGRTDFVELWRVDHAATPGWHSEEN